MQNGAIPVGGFPAVLDHEGAGVVRRAGNGVKVKTLSEGDQVLLTFTTRNTCIACNEGRTAFCRDYTLINFAGVRGISVANSPISFLTGQPIWGQLDSHH